MQNRIEFDVLKPPFGQQLRCDYTVLLFPFKAFYRNNKAKNGNAPHYNNRQPYIMKKSGVTVQGYIYVFFVIGVFHRLCGC